MILKTEPVGECIDQTCKEAPFGVLFQEYHISNNELNNGSNNWSRMIEAHLEHKHFTSWRANDLIPVFDNWRHHNRPKDWGDTKIEAHSHFTGNDSKTLPPIASMSQ